MFEYQELPETLDDMRDRKVAIREMGTGSGGALHMPVNPKGTGTDPRYPSKSIHRDAHISLLGGVGDIDAIQESAQRTLFEGQPVKFSVMSVRGRVICLATTSEIQALQKLIVDTHGSTLVPLLGGMAQFDAEIGFTDPGPQYDRPQEKRDTRGLMERAADNVHLTINAPRYESSLRHESPEARDFIGSYLRRVTAAVLAKQALEGGARAAPV